MTLKIKPGMLVQSVDRENDIRYKVHSASARAIIGEETLNRLKLAPRQSPLATKLGSITWICYVSQKDHQMYFCPEIEFCDGRFQEVPRRAP